MTASWWKDIEPGLWRFASESAGSVRERHAAILGGLLLASTRMPMVTLAELRKLLSDINYRDPVADELLRDELDYLVKAGLVKPFKDYTAPVTSYGDATRRQEAWALTKQGRIVVRAVRSAVNDIDRSLQLPPRLLDAVDTTVRNLLSHLSSDPELLAPDLAQVRAHLEQLQSATGDFYGAVAALVQSDVTDDSVFTASRERILLALQQFARQTHRSLDRVRRTLAELRGVGHAVVVERAVPGAGVIDAGGQQNWVTEMRQHLEGLEAWFEPRGSIDRLIDSAAGAIHTLLGAIDRRYYATTRGSDLGSDFRHIARMLHAQPSEEAAHQVFAAAFGMWPARHPRLPGNEDVAPAANAAEGASCSVQVTLRRTETGRHAAGRPRKIPDVTADREAAEAATIAEIERMRMLSVGLATPGIVSLDHFTGLDAEHTTVLVGLLEEALDAFDPATGTGIAASPLCQLQLWPGEPDLVVTVRLTEGTLTAPDLRVLVSLLEQVAEEEVA